MKNIRNIGRNVCRIKCPEDCFKVYYSSELRKMVEFFGNKLSFETSYQFDKYSVHRRVVWDRSQPILAYIEKPVLTFSKFVVNCGGLMGLWFGKSAKDLIIWIINFKTSNTIDNSIRSSLLLFSITFITLARYHFNNLKNFLCFSNCNCNCIVIRISIKSLFIKCY